jgi:DNA-directed RNA polymerase specialized sigma24 family protein
MNPIPTGEVRPRGPALVPPPAERTSPLDELMKDKKQFAARMAPISRRLTAAANARGVFDQNAQDAIHDAFVVAFEREKAYLETGDESVPRWDGVRPLEIYLVRVMQDVIKKKRRRRGTDSIDDDGAVPDDGPLLEELMLFDEGRDERVRKVQQKNLRESDTGRVQQIIDSIRRGKWGYDELAADLRCTRQEIRAAMVRLRRRFKIVGEE